jgi:hypothetical protein
MHFEGVIYTGPVFSDAVLLNQLPPELATLLLDDNGFVAVRGGLHVRGTCHEPTWHSLRAAWLGSDSVASRYPSVRRTDIPFAQDALGDQFLLRDSLVYRLATETGEVESLGTGLAEFLHRAADDPVEFLNLAPLLAFEQSGGRLAPGQLLNVYPPFAFEAPRDRSYRACPADEQLSYLASVAAQLRDLPDGARVQFKIIP